jgi:Rrf2 family protein
VKISSKARYGLFILAELAISYNKNELVQIKAFARKRGLSMKYLEQVILSLRASNLIESVRGPRGGYKLVKAPSDIFLYEILMAIQGKFTSTCYASNSKKKLNCLSGSYCLTINLLNIFNDAIHERIKNLSLLEFIEAVPQFESARCVEALEVLM